MELKILKASIISNNIPRFLIFHVKEPTLAKQYITSISNSLNKPYKYYDSIESVIYDIETNVKEDYVYVIFNPKEGLNEGLFNRLILLGKNVILYYSEINTRLNIYKNYNHYVVDFNPIDPNTMLAYVQKVLKDNNVTVNQDKVINLIDCCNSDLGMVLNELDKIITLEQSHSNLLFDYMANNGFSDYRQVNVFRFINKIINRDKSVLSDLSKLEDSPITVFINLYNTARNSFLKTRQIYYVNIMKKCAKYHGAILAGEMSDEYAIKLLIYEVMFR